MKVPHARQSTQNGQSGLSLPDLLFNEPQVRTQPLAVVQVPHCVARQVAPGQDDGILGDGAQNTTGESLHHVIVALITCSTKQESVTATQSTTLH